MLKTIGKAILLGALAYCGSAVAQQGKGDKEIGIGGQLYVTSAEGTSSGTASFQFSFGYFASVRNYLGVEVDPALSITSTPDYSYSVSKTGQVIQTQSGSTTSTSASGYFGGNYRRMVGPETGKVFFFIGGGGGLYLEPGLHLGVVDPEVGFKFYISQKSSLEFAYKLLYELNAGAGLSFADKIVNQATISVRHIF